MHLLVDLHPDNNLSHLHGSLKSATSRILRKEFPELKRFCKKGLWGKQLYIRSAGGAPLATLKKYIESHTYG
ncbi:MAG: transposase [Pleurocapsa sp.]